MSPLTRCPYCAEVLETPPRQNGACPHCLSMIVVRGRRLLTIDEAARSLSGLAPRESSGEGASRGLAEDEDGCEAL